jgi:hypothetical protein
LSRVRLHADAFAARSAEMFKARAYTVGLDVFLGAGEYRPKRPQVSGYWLTSSRTSCNKLCSPQAQGTWCNDLPRGTAYPDELRGGAALARAVGFETLALGCFLGPAHHLLQTLQRRIPNFTINGFLSAVRQDPIDWTQVEGMLHVPQQFRMFQQQQVFRAARPD